MRTIFIAVLLLMAGWLIPHTVLGQNANEAKSQTRRIQIEAIGFSIDTPSHWQLTLNERARQFIKIVETDENGGLRTASLNIQYVAFDDKPFPQIVDTDAYAAIVKSGLQGKMSGLELLKVETFELSGYSGAIIQFRCKANDLNLRMTHCRVVHPDGRDAYVITYGTLDNDWARVETKLKQIVASIAFDAAKE